MSGINISVGGLADAVRMLQNMAGDGTIGGLDAITETYARKMAEESAAMAPIDTSALKNSIASSPQPAEAHVWEYGSNLPYAVKMEYTHPEKKTFIRKAIWDNKQPYRDALEERILRS